MSDRRERMPPEFRNADPETFIDVFETDDGQFLTPTRGDIGSSLEQGRYNFAFALMQYQLLHSSKAIMRRAGCQWRRSDAIWFQEADYDARADIEAMVADATEFMSLGGQDEQTGQAYETLLTLKWQTNTIDGAATDAERETLRRMALASVSLGFLSAHAGIEGVEQSLTEIMTQAKIARTQQDGGDRGRAVRVERAEAWRAPIKEFARAWFERHRPTQKYGTAARIVADFRAAMPEVQLPGSDVPGRVVGACVAEYFKGK